MAYIVGGIGTAHPPSMAFARRDGVPPQWRGLFAAYAQARDWIAKVRPDLAVVFYNDHLNSLFFDNYPTFALGAADAYPTADEGFGKWPFPDFPGHADFSWHLAERLVADEFDIAVCQELEFDHGIVSWAPLLFELPPIPFVPIAVNVIRYPLPSVRRCWKLGQAVRRAVAAWPGEARVLVVGTGGLSHQTSNQGFGFTNPDWDRDFMAHVASAPESLLELDHAELARRGGAESVEMMLWLAMRGALAPQAACALSHYELPGMTGCGLLALSEGSEP